MNKTKPQTRSECRREQRELVEQQKRQGKKYPRVISHANRKCEFKSVEEELEASLYTIESTFKVYNSLLPGLLQKLSRIPDPRQPKKVKHKLTVIMLYGIFMFVFQVTSRREANKEMTTQQFIENMQAFFPEINDMPHQDTLCRLLKKIDVSEIENDYIEMLNKLIRKKTFKKLLHDNRYLVAIDGTQKCLMNDPQDKRYLHRRVGEDGRYQYYAFVLEAVLIFSNGMVLPLMSEFLENSPELEAIEDDKEWKQDCELKAFYRLTKRLKKRFPRLPITLLLDGLYAKGPVMDVCLKNKWKYMIVLKDGSLPTVWQEFNELRLLDTEEDYLYRQNWQGRQQTFTWVNGIEYEYGLGKNKKVINIHLATCKESWDEVDKSGKLLTKTSRHAWIFSEPITKSSIHENCNMAARKRWLHENNILKEKHQGYNYEHIFSEDWNAMRGYHYLMHIGRALNELVVQSVNIYEIVKKVGIQYFIKNFREMIRNKEFDLERFMRIRKSPGQLRLMHEDSWQKDRVA